MTYTTKEIEYFNKIATYPQADFDYAREWWRYLRGLSHTPPHASDYYQTQTSAYRIERETREALEMKDDQVYHKPVGYESD